MNLVYTPAFIERDKFPAIRDEYDYPILATAIMEDIDVLITERKGKEKRREYDEIAIDTRYK